MLVKPLFTSSQGHAIWDGDLIINWDLAGYHGEAFWNAEQPQHVEHLKPGVFERSLFGNPRCTLSL